jgi:hypothetical protein
MVGLTAAERFAAEMGIKVGTGGAEVAAEVKRHRMQRQANLPRVTVKSDFEK